MRSSLFIWLLLKYIITALPAEARKQTKVAWGRKRNRPNQLSRSGHPFKTLFIAIMKTQRYVGSNSQILENKQIFHLFSGWGHWLGMRVWSLFFCPWLRLCLNIQTTCLTLFYNTKLTNISKYSYTTKLTNISIYWLILIFRLASPVPSTSLWQSP